MNAITLSADANRLTLTDVRRVWQQPVRMLLDDATLKKLADGAGFVAAALERNEPVYGINTGFGALAKEAIAENDLVQLQNNLLLSHSAGTGEYLDDAIVRLIMVLKIINLAQGYSGVSPSLVQALCALLEHEIYPCIPSKGSVGASGDLAPLAHMSAVLIGVGHARCGGIIVPAAEALERAGLSPLQLRPKEGLALINGTQVSTAIALAALLQAEQVFAAACVAGALSVDAARGSDTPFDARVHELRRHRGQIETARLYRELLAGSEIRGSHLQCERVQDPYSLRCQPQVMGACLDGINHVAGVLMNESLAVTDNPLVFSGGDVVSGGNFHAEPVALVCDFLATAIAEMGALSERRTALLIDTNMSGLPPFLVEHSGLNSGFMIAQVTAVALAAENKMLAHPLSVDSLPTSANQEDHVSMATAAALRLHQMLENTADIIAIELLAACQGIEFHRPLRSSDVLESVVDGIRARVARFDRDRPLAPDIRRIREQVMQGEYLEYANDILPSTGI